MPVTEDPHAEPDFPARVTQPLFSKCVGTELGISTGKRELNGRGEAIDALLQRGAPLTSLNERENLSPLRS